MSLHYLPAKVAPSAHGLWNAIVGSEGHTLCGLPADSVSTATVYSMTSCPSCRILLDRQGIYTFHGEEVEELNRMWALTK